MSPPSLRPCPCDSEPGAGRLKRWSSGFSRFPGIIKPPTESTKLHGSITPALNHQSPSLKSRIRGRCTCGFGRRWDSHTPPIFENKPRLFNLLPSPTLAISSVHPPPAPPRPASLRLDLTATRRILSRGERPVGKMNRQKDLGQKMGTFSPDSTGR